MEKVVFTTGGTGGHIYPALSIAKKVREKGIDTLFIGTKHRMEKDIVPKENFRFIGLDVLPLRSIKSVFKMMKATMDTIKLLKKEKPTKIIAFGNYITIPVLVAANVLRIPYYLQEQNHTMGQANKWFYKGAKKVFVAFENTLESVKEKYKGKFVVTGNPLREEFYTKNKKEERKKLGIEDDEHGILIIGGSLGAKNINEAVSKKWKKIMADTKLKLFWATGKDNFEEATYRMRDFGKAVVKPYFENVPQLMAACDLVICRAGASTISELIELEKPSILIPYDFVGQKENADVLEFENAAKIFTNETVEEAIDEALSLVKQKTTLEFMSGNIKNLKKGKIAEFAKGLQDEILSSLSYFDTDKDEKYYKVFLIGIFIVLGDDYIRLSEREAGYGRADLVLEPKNKENPAYIFEFKTTENESELESYANEGFEQIKVKEYDVELKIRGVKEIIYIGLAFYRKMLKMKYEKVEF